MEGQPAALWQQVLSAVTSWSVETTHFNGRIAERLGLARSDLQCLAVLTHAGPSTAAHLARRVGLTTGSASRMIDRLVAAGYVTRSPDPLDRRKVVVAAVPAAVAPIGEMYRPLDDRLAAHLAELDEAELGVLLRFARAAERMTAEEAVPL